MRDLEDFARGCLKEPAPAALAIKPMIKVLWDRIPGTPLPSCIEVAHPNNAILTSGGPRRQVPHGGQRSISQLSFEIKRVRRPHDAGRLFPRSWPGRRARSAPVGSDRHSFQRGPGLDVSRLLKDGHNWRQCRGAWLLRARGPILLSNGHRRHLRANTADDGAARAICRLAGLGRGSLLPLAITARHIVVGIRLSRCELADRAAPYRVRVHLDAELAMPFVPPLILAYLSLNLIFIPAPFILRTRRELQALALSLVVMTTVAGIGFLLFPAELAYSSRDPGAWSVLFDFGAKARPPQLQSGPVASRRDELPQPRRLRHPRRSG